MSTVYINNLNEKVSVNTLRNELRQVFKAYNPTSIYLRKTLMMKGQAFVLFPKSVDANVIIKRFNNHKILQKPMRLKIAKTKSFDLLDEQEITAIRDTKIWKKLNKPNTTLIMTLNESQTTDFDTNDDDNHDQLAQTLKEKFETFEGYLNFRMIKLRRVCFIDFETIDASKRCFHDIDIAFLQNHGKLTFAK